MERCAWVVRHLCDPRVLPWRRSDETVHCELALMGAVLAALYYLASCALGLLVSYLASLALNSAEMLPLCGTNPGAGRDSVWSCTIYGTAVAVIGLLVYAMGHALAVCCADYSTRVHALAALHHAADEHTPLTR